MWTDWKSRFLSSHAAGLKPAVARKILDEFLSDHPEFEHAPQTREVESNGFVEHPRDGEGGPPTEASRRGGAIDRPAFRREG